MDGLGLPLPGEETKAQREGKRWGQDQTYPWHGGLLRRVGLFVLLFSKSVCRKAEGVQLCFGLVWSARSGNNSSFTPKLTPADPSGHGLPRTVWQHYSAPQLSSFTFWRTPPHN